MTVNIFAKHNKYYDIGSNRFYNLMKIGGLIDSSRIDIQNQNTMAIVYIAVALALDLASCVTLFFYRKRYPILERSPTLTIAASIFLLISTLPFPLWVMLKYN